MHRLRRLVRDERGDVSIDNVRRERDAATVQGGFGAVAVLCLAQFVDVLGVTSALTALPRMLHGVGASPSSAALVATAYAMMFGGLLILGARAGDTYGARRVLVAGLLLFAVAGLIGAVAGTVIQLTLARGMQG